MRPAKYPGAHTSLIGEYLLKTPGNPNKPAQALWPQASGYIDRVHRPQTSGYIDPVGETTRLGEPGEDLPCALNGLEILHRAQIAEVL